MDQIFISYKRADKDKVLPLVAKIENELGCKCWVDLDGIESSAQFRSVICRAINRANVVLFMHSFIHLNIDFETDWTIKELNYAETKKKRVVLVKLDDAPLDDIFLFEYGSKNNIDSNDPIQLNNLLNDLKSWLDLPSDMSSKPSEGLHHKVQPEPLCPCGSGKLFKDCHGKSAVKQEIGSLKTVAQKQTAPKQLKPADISKVNTSSHIKSGFLCPCGSGRLYRDCHGGPSMHYMVDSPRPHPVDRVWQVGDYYNYDGKEGIVFWVDESRKHGKIISMDHSNLQWCIKKENEKGVVTNANNRKNGKRNGQFIISIDDWKNKYPAFLWCLNHGDDWYLPAIEELEELLLNKEVHARVNKTLKERNATQLFDRGQGYFYWSSTEEGLWGAWAIDLSFGFSFHYRRRGKCYVRAVSAF